MRQPNDLENLKFLKIQKESENTFVKDFLNSQANVLYRFIDHIRQPNDLENLKCLKIHKESENTFVKDF